jgi:hypothetical protein
MRQGMKVGTPIRRDSRLPALRRPPLNPYLNLQRQAGNRAVSSLLGGSAPHAIDTPVVQRECACGGSCPECQGTSGQGTALQRQADSSKGPATPAKAVPANSQGRPLDTESRRFMEPRFGRDFSSVRVHTDAAASESARNLSANAYTTGADIYFASG